MVKTSAMAGTMSPAEMEARAGEVAGLLKTLSHPARLRLACALAEGEYAVGELEERLGIRQPTLSQQLGVLRSEGLVATRRDGQRIYYSIADERVAALIGAIHNLYCNKREMKAP